MNAGYKAPVKKKVTVVGATGYATLLLGAQGMYDSGFISEHDLKLRKSLRLFLQVVKCHMEQK